MSSTALVEQALAEFRAALEGAENALSQKQYGTAYASIVDAITTWNSTGQAHLKSLRAAANQAKAGSVVAKRVLGEENLEQVPPALK